MTENISGDGHRLALATLSVRGSSGGHPIQKAATMT